MSIKYFGELIQENSKGSWANFEIGRRNPSWEDLENKRIALPKDFESLLKKLRDKHWCILAGPKKTGKTWICYALGFKLRREYKVYPYDIRFVAMSPTLEPDEVWYGDIEPHKGRKKAECYYFFEDCHLNPKAIIELLGRIQEEENLRFLFTFRIPFRKRMKIPKSELEEILLTKATEDCIFYTIDPTEKFLEFIRDIIQKFVKIRNIETSEEDIENAVNKWSKGYDLVWVTQYLKNFRKGQKLSEIEDKDIFESILREDGDIKLRLPHRRNVLLPLSALCQFESLSVWPLFFENLPNVDVKVLREELEKEKLIEFIPHRDFELVSLPESWADLILLTYSRHDPNFERKSYTQKIFKQYLKTKPPNWIHTFLALYQGRKDYPFTKDIFSSLIRDDEIWQVIREKIKDISMRQITSLLWTLEALNEMEKAVNLWLEYLKYKNTEEISYEILNGEIHGIYGGIRIISRANEGNAKEILAKLADFPSVLNEKLTKAGATVQSNFLYDLYKLTRIKCPNCGEKTPIHKKICILCKEAIISEHYPLENRIKNLIKSLLMENEKSYTTFYVDFQNKLKSSSAPRIANAILPLNIAVDIRKFFEPFSISDYKRIAEKSSSSKIILLVYSFLRYNLREAAYNFTEIFEAFPDMWAHLIDSESLRDKEWSFKLLWNVCRIAPNRAKRIVQHNRERFFKGWIKAGIPSYYLAPLGLLHICNFDIRNVLISENIAEIQQRLDEFVKRKQPWLFVLSLIALKMKLPSRHVQVYEKMLNKQPLREYIYKNPDYQLRIVLRNLMTRYLSDG